MKKRLLSFLLCLCLCMSMLPGMTFAAENVPKGEGVIPDQEVSGPCDQTNVFKFDINALSGDTPTKTPYAEISTAETNSVIKSAAVTIGSGKETFKLTSNKFDEPRDGYIKVTVNLKNAGETYFYVHVILTGKYIVNITGVTSLDAVYDGTVKPGYSGSPVGTLTDGSTYIGNDIAVSYTDAEGNPLDEAPSEVGNYKVIFSVPESNETYKGSLTLPFRIISQADAEASYQAEDNGEWINTTFTDAVDKVYKGGTVKLLKNISIDSGTVLLDKDMTITSADSTNPCVVSTTTNAHSYLLRIGADVQLTNVIIDGGSESGLTASRALVAVGDANSISGKITLGNGSVIRNNNNTTQAGSGGGVCVISGECVINGGQITGNSANSGGGISLTGSDNLSLSLIAGSIDNNTATGVNAGYGYGGGVYMNGGSFTMSGGRISQNKAQNTYGDGAGIMIRKGSFTMENGEITGNTATRCGGALYAANADVTMKKGTIAQNEAVYGGAMYINPTVTLTLSGGSVTGNTATRYAGGIEIAPEATIQISGAPVVKGNTSNEEGTDGGMYFDYDSSGRYDPPEITIDVLGSGAELNWFTWMQSQLNDLPDARLQIAAPKEGRDAITTADLSKMAYIDDDYDLVLINGNMYLVARVPATGITLTPETLEMEVGDSETLTAVLTPDNTTCPVIWNSSDESIATVEDGVVTAHKAGAVTIRATAGDVSADCGVTVKVPYSPPVITTGTAQLTKVDAEDNSTVLPGVEFELYRANGTKVGTYTTNTSGVIMAWGLTPGTYYWVETRPAEGYLLDSTKRQFTVSVGSTTRLTVENSKSNVPEAFSDEHYAYVIGYDDGMVHPEANITRAEVATIFFRLLDESTRDTYLTKTNSFTDVDEDDWYNTAVSTMAAMGVVNGRPGDVFDPNANITRAEFAAIAARFDKDGNTAGASFTDIYGHWAESEINIAANNGWILGYDGKFRPDDYITRAEAMAFVNRVLQRIPASVDDLLSDMVVWTDNMDISKWYYLAIQEATNSHDYGRYADGCEYWTRLREVPDWTSLEQ